MCGRYFFELRELPAFARLKHKIEQQALFVGIVKGASI